MSIYIRTVLFVNLNWCSFVADAEQFVLASVDRR